MPICQAPEDVAEETIALRDKIFQPKSAFVRMCATMTDMDSYRLVSIRHVEPFSHCPVALRVGRIYGLRCRTAWKPLLTVQMIRCQR